MHIHFKSGILFLILIVSCSFTFAQSQTHKDVVLDGKPAKLNVKTGEVKLVKLKTINGKQVEVLEGTNSVIKSNLITNIPKKDKVEKPKADAISEESKVVVSTNTTDESSTISSENEQITTLSTAEKDAKYLKLKEEATKTVYDIDASTTLSTSASKVSEDNNTNFHRVAKGETLYSLSKRYNTSLGALKKANNLETTLIRVGQNLRVGNFEVSNYGNTNAIWTVSKGDTLYNIAHRNNTTVDAIKSLNGLVSNLIKIGQKLQLR